MQLLGFVLFIVVVFLRLYLKMKRYPFRCIALVAKLDFSYSSKAASADLLSIEVVISGI